MVDRPYDFAFDSKNSVDEKEADPAAAGLVFVWATTPTMLARIVGFARLEGLWAGDGGRKNQPDLAALHGLRVLRLNGATGDDLGFLDALADLRTRRGRTAPMKPTLPSEPAPSGPVKASSSAVFRVRAPTGRSRRGPGS